MNKEQFCAISLPHELKVLRGDNITILKVSGIDVDCKSILFTEKNTTTYGNINHSKPICHPLSDLTKSIEHKGETFVPIIELAKISMIGDEIEKFEVTKNKKYVAVYFENKETFTFSIKFMSFYSTIGNKSQIAPYQLNLFQKLIEWHFNLMDESEPFIDVNTLEINPYK